MSSGLKTLLVVLAIVAVAFFLRDPLQDLASANKRIGDDISSSIGVG